jgi:hypothetical protein
MWQLIQAGLNGINAYGSASVAAATARANNRLSRVQASTENDVRTAGNGFAAARGSLSRYMQSLQNNQTLEAGGEALEANLINAARTEDTLAESDFESQIRNAEQLGSQAAAAAFSGVGGEVADSVSVSTRLMQQRAARDALESRDFRIYDTARRAAAIQTQTVRSLDSSLIFDSLDYTMSVARRSAAPSPIWAAISAAGGSMADNGGQGFKEAGAAWRSAQGRFSAANTFGTGAQYGNQDYGNFI